MSNQKKIPTNKELQEFGLIFGVILVLLFGVLLPWIFGGNFPLWPWWILGVTGSMALIYPQSLKQLFDAWMLFGMFMGWINTRIILGVIFYFVFVPYGLMMRLFGKDLLSRKLDPTLSTYRIINNGDDKNDMEKPF